MHPPNNRNAVPTVSAINFENPSITVTLNPNETKRKEKKMPTLELEIYR